MTLHSDHSAKWGAVRGSTLLEQPSPRQSPDLLTQLMPSALTSCWIISEPGGTSALWDLLTHLSTSHLARESLGWASTWLEPSHQSVRLGILPGLVLSRVRLLWLGRWVVDL